MAAGEEVDRVEEWGAWRLRGLLDRMDARTGLMGRGEGERGEGGGWEVGVGVAAGEGEAAAAAARRAAARALPSWGSSCRCMVWVSHGSSWAWMMKGAPWARAGLRGKGCQREVLHVMSGWSSSVVNSRATVRAEVPGTLPRARK